MKKLFVILALGAFTFSTVSCRETTEEKMEDAAESAGNDIEEGAREAGDAVENAAEETGDAVNSAGQEVEEEIEGTDDYNGDDDN